MIPFWVWNEDYMEWACPLSTPECPRVIGEEKTCPWWLMRLPIHGHPYQSASDR